MREKLFKQQLTVCLKLLLQRKKKLKEQIKP